MANTTARLRRRLVAAAAASAGIIMVLGALQLTAYAALPAPTNLSPANGSTLTPDQFTSASWNSVTGSSTPITYRYESSLSSSTDSSGAFMSPAYQSGILSTTSISTTGTPPGTYWWHVRAMDSAGATSTWSTPWTVNVAMATSTGTTTPPTTESFYYPNAFPTMWYLLPGQTLSFTGSGFAPGETVTIQGDGVNATVVPDSSGHITVNNALTVPYSWANSTHSFIVTGTTSDGHVTPKPITIIVGTYYPQLTPSIWWVGYNQGMSAQAMGFAPNEQVKLIVNGTQVGQQRADGSGNVSFSFTTPGSGSTATLTAQGVSTGLTSTRTIYLHS